jgi:hypothetical protein
MHVKQESTVKTLACLMALASMVMDEVVGGDVADTLNGSPVGRDTFDALGANAVNQYVSTHKLLAK